MRDSKYKRSEELFEKASACIPVASQTFSKSYLQYPRGCSPLFLKRGMGGRVWDVDGNEYVDMVNGLLSVILGYADPDVDAAIQDQLRNGISFSLATELEIQLAERLIELIPCAEMVRYGKNGSDATSAAIRLARGYTKRDRIAVCGYHGWQDWYIGSTVRNLGVPKSVSELTHRFEYNHIDTLHHLFKQHPGEFAAVILEPINMMHDSPIEFLHNVKALTQQAGAVLIFDEIISGFRCDLGGAQHLFGVTPDLAAFGKSMGNGMPISAVVGRADIMRLMEEIFYSGTFGGETLSLAAAIAVIDKMKRENVIENLNQKGKRLSDRVQSIIEKTKLQEVFSLSGIPSWKFLVIKDYQGVRKEAIRTMFMQKMIEYGVLMQSSHNISYAHDERDLNHVTNAYEKTLSEIQSLLASNRFESALNCAVLEPIFKVR